MDKGVQVRSRSRGASKPDLASSLTATPPTELSIQGTAFGSLTSANSAGTYGTAATKVSRPSSAPASRRAVAAVQESREQQSRTAWTQSGWTNSVSQPDLRQTIPKRADGKALTPYSYRQFHSSIADRVGHMPQRHPAVQWKTAYQTQFSAPVDDGSLSRTAPSRLTHAAGKPDPMMTAPIPPQLYAGRRVVGGNGRHQQLQAAKATVEALQKQAPPAGSGLRAIQWRTAYQEQFQDFTQTTSDATSDSSRKRPSSAPPGPPRRGDFYGPQPPRRADGKGLTPYSYRQFQNSVWVV